MALFGNKSAYDRGQILRTGQDLVARGKARRALKEFERILAVDPNDLDVHAKAAPLFLKARRLEEAKQSYLLLTAQYEKQGFVEREIATWQIVRGIDPLHLAAYLRLVALYLERGVQGDALRSLRQGRRTFRRKRHVEQAIAIEERILSITPDDFEAQRNLVRLFWKGGKVREAAERLMQMEARWAFRKEKREWRKTRWLLFRHRPRLPTLWGYLKSLVTRPAPYPPDRLAALVG